MVYHLAFDEYEQIPHLPGSMYGSRRLFIDVYGNFKFSWPSAFEVMEAFLDLCGSEYNLMSLSVRVTVVALGLASICVLTILSLKCYQFIASWCVLVVVVREQSKVDV
jgi:hypothetical protein